MLEMQLTVEEPARATLLHARRGRFVAVTLLGTVEDLRRLVGAIEVARTGGDATINVTRNGAEEPLRLSRAVATSLVPLLPRGLLGCLDDEDARGVTENIRFCLDNAAASAPVEGYHSHYDFSDDFGDPSGTFTVGVSSSPG